VPVPAGHHAGNIAATIFWLKARAGWREKQLVEVGGPDGKALPAPQAVVIRPVFVAAQNGTPKLIEGHAE